MDRLVVLRGHLAPAVAAGEAQLRCQDTKGTTYEGFSHAQTMANFPPPAHDAFHVDSLLTAEERNIRDRTRAFMEQEVAPTIASFWEKAEFPHHLVPKLAKLNLGGGVLHGHGCPGQSIMGAAIANVEIARVDGSMSTFLMVHNSLAMLTLGLLGSEQQKQELLPRMASLEWTGAWALTEPSNGSDASALQSTARKVHGGWVLNGQKRWIGNATFAEIVVVWARNLDTKQINAFVVHKGSKGFATSKIENKIALRCVQNADIRMTDVFVPDSARLTGVNTFQDTNKVLAVSRIMVAWQPVGLCLGVYDMCVRYLKEREQFGAPLAAFQLSQEKLARMLGSCQAMFLMAWRLSKLHEAGQMTHEMASTVKAWNTRTGREVMALGRELLGGNGIVSDFLVAKAFSDMEAYHTYEGTYEVNVLVAGRGATGIPAIKARLQQKPTPVQA